MFELPEMITLARQINEAPARPCPECRGQIEKLAYLGGACYFCPRCQK